MNRDDFRFLDRLRVRRSEVDAQQSVFNAHYLTYLDTAITGYWRALALPYAPTMAMLQGDFLLQKSALEYHAPARFDDVLDIALRCEPTGTGSLRFVAAIFKAGQLLVSAALDHVFVDPGTQIQKPIPEALRNAIEAYEAGAAMVEVRTGAWPELGADAHPIRLAVFVREQGIPVEREWDDADADALHAVAYNRLGTPLGTGRLIPYEPGIGKVGRMAVIASARGGAVGRAVLDALVDAGRVAGYREIVLQAQVSASAFYRRAGFIERGEVHEEVGIPHVDMVRALR